MDGDLRVMPSTVARRLNGPGPADRGPSSVHDLDEMLVGLPQPDRPLWCRTR